jgi:predicted PurR-regulated permease PerM
MLLSLFFTIAAFIVFLFLQVPLALILAVIVGLFQLIPGIGATLGIGLVCLILLPKSVGLAFNVLIASIILQQIKDNLLAPRIMQNSLNINPVIGFFALLVGYRIAGLLGIFLATPIAGVFLSWFGIENKRRINWD